MNRLKGAAIGTAVGVGAAALIFGAHVAAGEWVVYGHEYAHAGIKFAPGAEAGCGIEIPTELGEAEGLEPFYCEHGDLWPWLPGNLYTTYYGE